MTEPTPRPWRFNEFEDGTIRADNWGVICTMPARIRDDHQVVRDANARLIVTAVNCHDELMALARLINSPGYSVGCDTHSMHLTKARDMANAILAKVREQESQG